MADTLDLLVIGAGTAGTTAAKKCAARDWSVAVVDERPFGGTCPLRGCDPKKMLRAAAEVVDAQQLMAAKGVAGDLGIRWSDLMRHRDSFTSQMPGKIETSLQKAGIETIHGRARFTVEDRAEIDGHGEVVFRHALVATGARPRPLEFTGAGHLIDSTGFLYLEDLPGRVVFVGGGYVSFEFAHIAARAGARVTILDNGARPLTKFDPDLVDMLLDRSRDAGIAIVAKASPERVEALGAGRGYRVVYEKDGERLELEADLVVHGAGRVPDTGHLNLPAAGIETEDEGVAVTPWLQSPTNARVFAAGDAAATSGKPLTPVASMEGGVAATNMLEGGRAQPDYTGVPSVVFTIPELARVGMLEEEARDTGDVEVKVSDASDWFSQLRRGETHAGFKIILGKDGRILGAHLFGPDYAELINIFALAIKLGLTADQIRAMPTAYPTAGSDIESML